MRLFLIGWTGKSFGHIDVVYNLKKHGHEIVYWTGRNLDGEIDKTQFPGTIFHEYSDVLWCRPPAGVGGLEFAPPGEELLEHFLGVESVVLTMMNKLFDQLPVSERKHLYYHYVGYWFGVFKKLKPDAVLFLVAPHTNYDFVIYSLAKLLGVKTLLFMLTRLNDRILFMNDFVLGSIALKAELQKNKNQNWSLNDLAKDIRDYYVIQKTLAKPIPIDVINYAKAYSGFNKLLVKLRSFWTTLTVLKDYSIFLKILTHPLRRFGQNQKTEYAALAAPPDFSKKFIYAALNQQPESTTSPLGGIFVDQLLMLKVLSSSIPSDWLIYVKEHPMQWKLRGSDYFSYRYRGYYKAMAALHNVRIVPINTDNFYLIDKSQCVATVNGTTNWEAVLRGKPSLVFGYAWYREAPGVFKVNNAEACKVALKEIIDGRVQVARQDIINYLFSFDKASIRAYTDEYFLPVTTVSIEESVQNYTRVILNELT
ncbi:hypothetical protein A2926_03510 [Candidatus Giovannonibacteria bacterium RIFCSPLOWO2_01_FULL_44_40]|uniref:Capsule polysaccharide biosynthesis protein n=1 Tax=Candidatus Giovannonibacteria bacterium RIFCSPHIGHO2_01_FULL_45_23 TaxID=1798325 RepID=A0A1F5VGE0_9BACT|nr:MAG: hypothetical protein A2834_03485 [Candidatus Giovannonibacteria bacterium RIFCSPHIGHO2_01_FULL_45_23]OGF75702.1 MAG: hypothetical protein A3C77_01765 [Candidatus Giovannonibacteria bacterium RIFCSPHIGHO2_02_FULL_45_13]OGF79828.1 MAG: hypothetical protein A2926_03510 [Candidatus Giovannonibacteria bacterium RIFCSPLOWO2_01_FULL_44_40]